MACASRGVPLQGRRFVFRVNDVRSGQRRCAHFGNKTINYVATTAPGNIPNPAMNFAAPARPNSCNPSRRSSRARQLYLLAPPTGRSIPTCSPILRSRSVYCDGLTCSPISSNPCPAPPLTWSRTIPVLRPMQVTFRSRRSCATHGLPGKPAGHHRLGPEPHPSSRRRGSCCQYCPASRTTRRSCHSPNRQADG